MNTIERCKPLLGTYVEVCIGGDCNDNDLLEWSIIVFEEIERIHNLLGFHQLDSELTRVNNALLTSVEQGIYISDDFNAVLSFALALNRLTDGHFDVCVAPLLIKAQQLPNHLNIELAEYGNSNDLSIQNRKLVNTKHVCIDLGGIAKGYAVDCAVKKIPSTLDITINAGGDMYRSNWQGSHVWLKYAKRNRALKHAKMLNCALASSGSYYSSTLSAIYHPQKAQPQKITGGISVFASSTMVADALTKVVALLPKAKVKPVLAQFKAQTIKVNCLGMMSTL